MAGVNKVFLLGRVGREPTVRETQGGKVVQVSLATHRTFVDKAGVKQERTEWHRLVAWGRTAEEAETLTKGQAVHVEGALEYREFEHQGVRRMVAEVRVFSLSRLVESARSQEAPARATSHRPAPAASASHGYGELDESEVPF